MFDPLSALHVLKLDNSVVGSLFPALCFPRAPRPFLSPTSHLYSKVYPRETCEMRSCHCGKGLAYLCTRQYDALRRFRNRTRRLLGVVLIVHVASFSVPLLLFPLIAMD